MLLKLLNKNTDENNPISTTEIMDYFQKHGMSVDRKTLRNDINLLVDMDYNIVTVKSSPNKYFWGQRSFEIPELKLLIDAVQSSRFISKKKSKELIKKLTALASDTQAKQLNRHITATGRVKTSNENTYYIVDAITDAINDKKKIEFQYEEYNGKKEKILRNDGEVYVLSPYSLFWNEDFYYVVGYSDKRERITAFRVDHLHKVKISVEKAVQKPKEFKIEDYSNKIFEMFNGEETVVKLSCDNSLMKYVIDRFGEAVETQVETDNTFITTVSVELSPVFYGWIFQFGGKVKIVGPASIVKQYEHMRTIE